MTPDDWQRLKTLLDGALQKEAGAREAYLREACGDDAEMLARAESLIVSSEESWAGLEGGASGLAEREEGPRTGQRIGAYEILEEIGHGGMGTVYLGRRADEEFRQQVAIKLVRRGMDTDFVLRRFRTERQILAGLEHPNIARLLDGGATADGQPYFVMEYVEGQPLPDYCDSRRLPISERLTLFLDVCSAVQFAHQNLVVHRDLKPANVLVTADGTVKLLDFGIAKLLNPELSSQTLDRTASVLRLMTPDYASPEQVRGEPITTSSDVYSLGVVLYELLTGHRPYRVSSAEPGEIGRVVCEQVPEKPSIAVARVEEVQAAEGSERITLTPESVSRTREGEPQKLKRRLMGDLDNIVLMALRKEPQRRYASVGELAEDIRRHLDGRPVRARKDTVGYRTGKFVRRHGVLVTAVALVFLSLVGGIGVSVRQAAIARSERARAQKRFDDVRKLADSLLFEFQDSIKNLAGSTPARELLVRRGLEYLDSLAAEAGTDPLVMRDLAQGYSKLGDLQGDFASGSATLGDTDGSIRSYRKARAILEKLVELKNAAVEDRLALADLYGRMSDPLARRGDSELSVDLARRAVGIAESLVGVAPSVAERYLPVLYQSLGVALTYAGRNEDALTAFQKNLALAERVAASDLKDGGALRAVAVAHVKVADALGELDRNEAAVEEYRKALLIEVELTAREPGNAKFKRDLSFVHQNLAEVLRKSGSAAEAAQNSRKTVELRRELAAADPKNPNPRLWLATAHAELGEDLVGAGDLGGAMSNLREAIALFDSVLAETPGEPVALQELAWTQASLGNAYRQEFSDGRRLESLHEARSWFEKSRKTYADLQSQGRLPGNYAKDVDAVTRKLAECDQQLARSGRH